MFQSHWFDLHLFIDWCLIYWFNVMLSYVWIHWSVPSVYYIYIYIQIITYIYMYNTHTHIYIYVKIYICVCMCIQMYIYIYTYLYIYYIKSIYVLVLFGTRLPASMMEKKTAVTTAQHQNPPEDLTMGMCIFPCAHTRTHTTYIVCMAQASTPHFPLRPHAMVMVLYAGCM